jgi:hypothetical protein
VPILPGSGGSRAGALTFVGEASLGSGHADNFTSLSGGTVVGAPLGVPKGVTYSTGVPLDNGPAGFNTVTGDLDTVDWRSLLVNLQYFTPLGDGAVWVNGLFSMLDSDNIAQFSSGGAAFDNQKYAALGLFIDPTASFRIGLEGQWTRQSMTDGSVRVNRRAQLLFIFNFPRD